MNTKYTFLLALLLLFGSIPGASGQNLIFNGDFNLSNLGWTTSCVNVEAWGFETTYGGPSPTNHVAEIDDQACMHQDICIIPGLTYTYSMDASRRTGGGADDTIISHINIIGMDAGGATLITYVDMDYVRYNTTFAFTPVTGIPSFYVSPTSGVVRLRLTLTDNTPGYSTFGMIIDNLSLTYVTPPALITGTDTACINSPLTFSVSGISSGPAVTYSWTFGAAATPATCTTPSAIVSWSTPGTYPISVVIGNGVCFPDTLHASVYIRDRATDTIHASVCGGTPYMFNGLPIYTSGLYNDTFPSVTGCDSIATLILSVNPKPAPPVITSPTYCQNDPATPLSAAGSSLTWYGPGVTGGYTTTPTPYTTIPGTVSYYVTQSVGGCVSDSAKLDVIVKPTPPPPTTKDYTYCQGATANALSATGSNLLWYTVPAGGVGSSAQPIPVTSLTGTFTWFVSQVVNGCESSRTPQHVTVIPAPIFTIGATHLDVCQGDTISLYYNGVGAATYQWTLPLDAHLISGSANAGALVARFDTNGHREIYLTATDATGKCTATDSIRVNIVPTPWAKMFTPEACLGDTVALALISRSGNADSFYWYVDNYPLFQSPDVIIISHNTNTGGPFELAWVTTGKHVIGLYTSTSEGCRSAEVLDSTGVHNLPDPTFTYSITGDKLCVEDSVLFHANERSFGDLYQWSPDNSFNNTNQPDAWGRVMLEKSVITLMVTDPYGCKASSNLEIDPSSCCALSFPNAFTPNGDGKNDFFYPIASGHHQFHEFRIVNRWGQTVFESASNELQWDGRFNGQPQDMGTYYYYVKYDCGSKTFEQKGDVTLVR